MLYPYATWFVRLLEHILPRRFWYRNFYLKSMHWKKVRYQKLKKSHYRCFVCGAYSGTSRPLGHRIYKWVVRLDVHHLSYDNLYHEKLHDLRVLCRDCHNEEHYGKK